MMNSQKDEFIIFGTPTKKTERSDSIVRSAAGGSIVNRHFLGFRQLDFRKKQTDNRKYRKDKNSPQTNNCDFRKPNGITGSKDSGYKGAENADNPCAHNGANHPVPYHGPTGAQCDGRAAQYRDDQ